MPEPLDFSSVSGKKETPPRPDRPRRPGPGRGSRVKTAVLAAVAVVVLAVVVILVLNRDGDDQGIDPVAEARYCELAATFDRLAPVVGEGVDPSVDGAERLFEEMGDTAGEMEADAPSEIRADVQASVAGFRAAAAGNPAALRDQEFLESRQRMIAHRTSSCTVGSGEGD